MIKIEKIDFLNYVVYKGNDPIGNIDYDPEANVYCGLKSDYKIYGIDSDINVVAESLDVPFK